MSSTKALFTPLKLGNNLLQHRVVLAPLTRFRADSNAVPTELVKEYYTQRATNGGLLITEATFITRHAGSYPGAPGIYTKEQINAWKTINDAIHAKGGLIFVQLWHLGRVASSAYNEGQQPVSSSAITVQEPNIFGQPHETPRALEINEIKSLVQDFRQAALNAVEAGFDGVEIHAANGYLLDQFINSNSNKRTDEYGGSVENRGRFALEIVDAVSDAIGEERMAIRFSPWSGYQEVEDDTPYETWGYLTKSLQENHPNLAYLHFIGPRETEKTNNTLDPFRQAWKGPFITADGYSTDTQLAFDIAEETGNLIAFGRVFIANPDLVERLKNDWPMNDYNRDTFYDGGSKGYIDYPFYKH